MKEILLIITVIISFVLLMFNLFTLNRLTNIDKIKKNIIIVISILCPIVGAIWVVSLKKHSNNN